jgi:hypothetical protein
MRTSKCVAAEDACGPAARVLAADESSFVTGADIAVERPYNRMMIGGSLHCTAA